MQSRNLLRLSESERNCLALSLFLTHRSGPIETIKSKPVNFLTCPKFKSTRNQNGRNLAVSRWNLSRFQRTLRSQEVIKVVPGAGNWKPWSRQKFSRSLLIDLSFLLSQKYHFCRRDGVVNWPLPNLLRCGKARAHCSRQLDSCRVRFSVIIVVDSSCITFPSSQPRHLVTESGVAR